MADQQRKDRAGRQASEQADERRERQEQQDPSGHGMQVTPRQQQQIAESSQPPDAVAVDFDEEALDDLKGETKTGE